MGGHRRAHARSREVILTTLPTRSFFLKEGRTSLKLRGGRCLGRKRKEKSGKTRGRKMEEGTSPSRWRKIIKAQGERGKKVKHNGATPGP